MKSIKKASGVLCAGVSLIATMAHAQPVSPVNAPTAPAAAQDTPVSPNPEPNAPLPASPVAPGPVAPDRAGAVPNETAAADIVVTGSRLSASGFSAPTPVTVLGSAAIEQRAPAKIADVINEQPALRVTSSDTSRNGSAGLPTSQQNLLDLRALGPTRTLTLINGHRSVGTNWQGTVDTNIVPVGLVDRIDIVTGGASAAYGSDAVAGVVNIVLREKMQGITASMQGGVTEYGTGTQVSGDLAGGTAFADGRGQIIGGVDFNRTSAINDTYGTRFGASELGIIQPTAATRAITGQPQNVLTTGVEPGTSAPGGLVYQNTVGGKAYTFDGSGNPVLFNQGTLANGQFMTGSTANYGYNLSNVAPLRARNSRVNLYSRASFELTPHLTVFLEGSYAHSSLGPYKTQDVIAANGSNISALTISTSNPFVTPAILSILTPGTTSFKLGRINTEYGGQFTSQTLDNHRIVGGFKGAFLTDWTWEAYGETGRTTQHLDRTDLNLAAFQKAVNGCADTTTGLSALQRTQLATYESVTGLTCTPFNPFGVGRNNISATDYFNYHTSQVEHIGQDVAAASVTGSLFSLPAGAVHVAAGGEYRRESVSAISDPISRLGNLLTGNLVQFSGHYHVKEGFAEVGVPIFRDQPFAKSLDLNAAARVTDYQLSGTVETWKAGATWEPADFLRLRFTRSRDIRAPNLFDIFLVGGVAPGTVANHIAAGVTGAGGTVNPVAGSNAAATLPINMIGSGGGTGSDFKPEIANTTTFGGSLNYSGARFSVDYYHIDLGGAITRPTTQQVVDLCRDGVASQCQNITFSSTVAGGIAQVVARSINLNTTTVSGIDFELSYNTSSPFDLPGRFMFRALVNYGLHFRTYTPLNGLTEEDINTLLATPKVSYNVNIGYELGRLAANVQLRGFMRMRANPIIYNPDGTRPNTILGPEDAGYVAGNSNTVNVNRYPGQLLVNPSIDFALTKRIGLFLNIDNLFDAKPPTLFNNASTVVTYYDLIGRRYRFGIRAKL